MSSAEQVLIVRDEAGEEVGWLVIDRLVGGLCFGGFRFSPTVTRGEVELLARSMTQKLALHGSPVGGAKAGLRCNPRGPKVEGLLDRFAEAARGALGTQAMVGRDLGATDAIIDGLYERLGHRQLHVLGMGGRLRDLPGYRRHMTGLGVAFAARRAVGGDLAGKRVAIQGFGLVGAGSAIRLEALGARVVAISDASGAVHDPAGLDIGRLYAASHGARVLPKGVATEPRDAVFEAEADVLVLAASSHSVSEHLAQGIAAPLVVEGSNFGLTEVARAVLQDRGVAVIPDLIASSSSAAMVARQMAARGRLGADELWSSIETAIDEATGIAMAAARESGTDVRTGYLAAFPCH